MTYCEVTDRREIESILRREPDWQLYAIGDLDARYWPHTRWPALVAGGRVRALALLYTRFETPVLMAVGRTFGLSLPELLRAIPPATGPRLYVHLAPGLEPALLDRYELRPHGEHQRMILRDRSAALSHDTHGVHELTRADADELGELYRECGMDAWFRPEHLDRALHVGLRHSGRLCAAATLHVRSVTYGVAAIGGVATHPDHRNRGHARRVTAALVQRLNANTPLIGLNVRSDNAAARRCYERLGFEAIGPYSEYDALVRGVPSAHPSATSPGSDR